MGSDGRHPKGRERGKVGMLNGIGGMAAWDGCLVSSVGRAPDCSAGGRGFEPQTLLTLGVLK